MWQLFKKLGIKCKLIEFHYHLLASISPTKNDFMTKRYNKLD